MPIRDANLDLSPATSDLPFSAVTTHMGATEDLQSQTGIHGLAVRFNYEWSHGSTIATVMNVTVRESATTPVASSDPAVSATIALACSTTTVGTAETDEYILPFHSTERYVAVEYTPTGVASDSPSFSVLEAFIVTNVGKNWDRTTNFL